MDPQFSQAGQLGQRLSEQLDHLRRKKPVFWSENQRAWLVTGHRETVTAFRDARRFSSAGREVRMVNFLPEEQRDAAAPYLRASLRRMLFSHDGKEHARLKMLMAKAFDRNAIEPYRPLIQDIVRETLDHAATLDDFDFIPEIAHRIPARTILTLLGLPHDLQPRLRQWSQRVTGGIGGGGVTPASIADADAACLEMREALLPEIQRRQDAPGTDFISRLLSAEADGERLDIEEVLANCYLVILAGHDTTSNTMALSTAMLAGAADLWSFLADNEDQEAVLNVVLELGRTIGMSYASARIMAANAELGGELLREGDLVYLMQGIANRDENIFADPLRVDIRRAQNANLTFGAGVHMCIGHLLAKMQLTAFLPAFTGRFAGLELLDERLEWAASIGFRGLERLNVRLLPR